MTTINIGDKAVGETKLLSASDLTAIYDTNTHILYLYARGTYSTPAQTSFVRQLLRRPPFGGLNFAFQGHYVAGEDPLKPTDHQFAEEYHLNLPQTVQNVNIVTADNKPMVGESVPVLRVPALVT